MSWMLKLGSSGLALVVTGTLIQGCHEATSDSSPTASVIKTAVAKGGAASRRNVKTAIDPDASKIDGTAKDTTVEDIASQKGPADGKLEGRTGPFETSTWKVKASLASIKLMKDHDYYVVLKGDKGGETVVEVPDPKDCKGSPLEPQIAAARKELEDRYHPTTTVKDIHDQATVTGVGFLGFGGAKKGSKGHSGPRLMPGLGFDFSPKS